MSNRPLYYKCRLEDLLDIIEVIDTHSIPCILRDTMVKVSQYPSPHSFTQKQYKVMSDTLRRAKQPVPEWLDKVVNKPNQFEVMTFTADKGVNKPKEVLSNLAQFME